jgi:hypothetical protein
MNISKKTPVEMIGRPADNPWNYEIRRQHTDFARDVAGHMLDKVFESLSADGRLEYGLLSRMSNGSFLF